MKLHQLIQLLNLSEEQEGKYKPDVLYYSLEDLQEMLQYINADIERAVARRGKHERN